MDAKQFYLPEDMAVEISDWLDEHACRLGQVQGFGYGAGGLVMTVRDCWLNGPQVVWQKQSTPEDYEDDHREMIRQIHIYRMSLAITAVKSGRRVPS